MIHRARPPVRKAIAAAMSQTVPSVCNGTCSTRLRRTSSSNAREANVDQIVPTRTAFTRMERGAKVAAAPIVSCSSAAFATL